MGAPPRGRTAQSHRCGAGGPTTRPPDKAQGGWSAKRDPTPPRMPGKAAGWRVKKSGKPPARHSTKQNAQERAGGARGGIQNAPAQSRTQNCKHEQRRGMRQSQEKRPARYKTTSKKLEQRQREHTLRSSQLRERWAHILKKHKT